MTLPSYRSRTKCETAFREHYQNAAATLTGSDGINPFILLCFIARHYIQSTGIIGLVYNLTA